MDKLTPDMEAMLRINAAKKLATTPDGQRVLKEVEPEVFPEEPVLPSEVFFRSSIVEVIPERSKQGKTVGHFRPGILRSQQIHTIMTGNWEVIGQQNSPDGKRSLTTSCGYKAKRVFTLKDRDTGRVISAALGEIQKHTNLQIPKDDKQARKLDVSSAFACLFV